MYLLHLGADVADVADVLPVAIVLPGVVLGVRDGVGAVLLVARAPKMRCLARSVVHGRQESPQVALEVRRPGWSRCRPSRRPQRPPCSRSVCCLPCRSS